MDPFWLTKASGYFKHLVSVHDAVRTAKPLLKVVPASSRPSLKNSRQDAGSTYNCHNDQHIGLKFSISA
ncbi:MAG: hypothetical protein D5R98_00030 [Desulfonatronovibrio sp. MSAO_Bac4]|nr:MAG: hypothetical protein D5R98_00030 [Desulfonatronovibrio sp. MSAO_Bac4]